MTDNEKTKEQLLLEIVYLKQVILDWERKYKALEDFAKSTEERFLNITSAVSDYIFSVHIVDGNPVETVHGPACYAITGYTPMEFYENPYLWINMVFPEDRAVVLDHVAKILSGKEVKPLEHRIIRKDGVIRWVRNTPVCQYDGEGKLQTYDGLIQDITDIKRTFETLKLSEEKFAKAFHSSPDIITITTISEGIFLDVNEAFVREFGYSREEIIGAKAKEFELWEDYSERETFIRELLETGKISNREIKMKTKTGDILEILASSELIVMGDERCMITVARDITKRKRLLLRLQQEKALLEENLKLQIAQQELLSHMLIEQYLNLAYCDMQSLNIPYYPEADLSKPLSDFIYGMNKRLPLDIQLIFPSDKKDPLTDFKEESKKIILALLYRIIEFIASCEQADHKTSVSIEIRDKEFKLYGNSPLKDNLFISFTGMKFQRDHSEYTLVLIADKLLNGKLVFYYQQESIACTLRLD